VSIIESIQQLERSERGQLTCKLLKDFFSSATVQGLDGSNSEAVAHLVFAFMVGGSNHASTVMDGLRKVIQRHQWVERAK
jgi:hypothetical protein